MKLFFILLRKNPVKVFYIVGFFLSLLLYNEPHEKTVAYKIIHILQYDDNYYYFYETSDGLKYLKGDKLIKLDNNKYYTSVSSTSLILSIFGLVIFGFFLLLSHILIITKNEDVGWEFRKCLVSYLYYKVRKKQDVEGKYVYVLYNKVLMKANENSYNIKSTIERCISDYLDNRHLLDTYVPYNSLIKELEK